MAKKAVKSKSKEIQSPITTNDRSDIKNETKSTTNESSDIKISNEIIDDTIMPVSPLRVTVLGIVLLSIGTIGFYHLPGMISNDAKGSRLVNAIYCTIITLTT